MPFTQSSDQVAGLQNRRDVSAVCTRKSDWTLEGRSAALGLVALLFRAASNHARHIEGAATRAWSFRCSLMHTYSSPTQPSSPLT